MFKRLDAVYRPGRRSTAWRKLKHRREHTLAVAAWTPGERELFAGWVSHLQQCPF